MKFSRSSRILGAALAVGSICLAMPQEASQGYQPSAPRVGEVPYEQSPYEETPYSETPREDSPEEPSHYEQPREQPSYREPSYEQPPRETPSCGHTPYGRDPAVSIIEWEVGSPALYAARSVDDPDTCPKGTGIYPLPSLLRILFPSHPSHIAFQNHHANTSHSILQPPPQLELLHKINALLRTRLLRPGLRLRRRRHRGLLLARQEALRRDVREWRVLRRSGRV